ncbi:pyocin knob domain-containing protein [Haemophilus influenzae]|uniref:pyocin knob domain-containing protein n=1 Tax=Haemophilus influenzae TaxID=727 RepID=UPI003C6FD63F
MADFNKPTVDSEYTQFPTEIRAAISAALSFLDGEHTNVPLKAKRWNPSTKIFEEYNGAQWVPMATEYKLPVDYNSLKNKPLPNSAVDDESDKKFASSAAVKTAYDKAAEAKEAASAKQSPATTLAGYGIGNFKVEQGQGDANGYKTDGNYYLASGQNLPENGAWHIEVVSGGATNAVRQIARKANDNKIKTRFFNGSNWSEWKDAGGDGLPLGAVVSFPRAVTNPVGFLRADGSTFSQQTFPDLYRTLGNSNQLPDLTRSDVGMTAYFAVDNIPAGWIAFDEIATQVTEQRYPELYRHLVGKYGSIASVPKVADRFLRNAGNGLSVGQTQEDELKRHVHKHIENNTATNSSFYNDKTFDYNSRDSADRESLDIATAVSDANNDNWWITPNINSNFATGGDETRPKSLILKLCIKAKNTFDDVQFWVKAFGVVENAGALDAGTLAQNMQALSARVDQEIEENKQYTLREINNAKSDINQQFLQAQKNLSQIGTLKTVWQGNVGSGRIDISEKCFGKTLILYLQSSSGHRLDDNNNIEPVSFEVGAEIEGKRGGGAYLHDIREVIVYNPRYNAVSHVEVKTFAVTVDRNGTTIEIEELAGRFVKRIDIR